MARVSRPSLARAWGRPGFLHAPFRRAVEGQHRTPAGYAVTSPHPDQGLDHRPTKRRSLRWSRTVVLRFRTVVARTNWRRTKTAQGDIDRLNPTSAQPSKAIATFAGTRPASCQ